MMALIIGKLLHKLHNINITYHRINITKCNYNKSSFNYQRNIDNDGDIINYVIAECLQADSIDPRIISSNIGTKQTGIEEAINCVGVGLVDPVTGIELDKASLA